MSSLPAWSSRTGPRLLAVLLTLLVTAASTLAGAVTAGAVAPGAAATPDRPRYDVSLRGDTDGSHWTGRQRVSFRNASDRPLREVYVRLWGNGDDGCGAAGRPSPVRVSKVRGGTPDRLTVNCTALRVTLPKPLAHGGRTTVAFDVSITVPGRNSRFGREGAFRFLGNALPVLAVHDAKGWHLDPYVATGESFYTLASDFRVRLDHPSALKVPATGRTWIRPGKPGRTVTRSVAARVRDFAWAAGPFRTATEISPGGVRVKSYWSPDTPAAGVRLTRQDGVAAVDRFGMEFGRYPYGEIDLVMTSGFGGGMEYPGLVLLGTTEEGGAVVHEVAHQWWYGIVGNDEYASPWLDESFAQYANARFYGWDTVGCWSQDDWPNDSAALTNSMAYWSTHRGEFHLVYTAGSCALADLERALGSDTMARLLKRYAHDHWYGVSTTADFKKAAQAATTRNLGPFWKQHRIR
ncbi:M1 family metallopeptidase [Streptomyces sp. WI04-05B]|uniref:M1 family metallopeptidase n=1 Tax=Streptomyces TaxID=1883 RepID=UPI0029B78019|nr:MULTISPECIES: M1 family metallopeptidase [unclassified Streptomyces]MDX2544589.1 M1 family metallopeptidase [Streptomyces sp. WI04-05B]MDX2588004.1 M1 family metallopeptidase [Streptomyces sp. WI04-05A]